MSKKLITACLALFALAAFVLPAAASASPVVTHPTGTKLATGATIVGTNTGTTFLKNDEGTATLAECNTAVIRGTLKENTGSSIQADITTATFTGTGAQDAAEAAKMPECTSTFGGITVTTNGGGVDENTIASGTPWCIKATAAGVFTLRGGLCSQASRAITFNLKSTTAGNCLYERTTAISGTNTTDTAGSTVLSVAANANTTFKGEAGNSFLCPATGTLQMSFTLETENKEPIYIS